MCSDKLRVHVKNNHASPETFPPTKEGETVFTITDARFQAACDKYPDIAKQIEVLIDWDLDRFSESMQSADVLVGPPGVAGGWSRTPVYSSGYAVARTQSLTAAGPDFTRLVKERPQFTVPLSAPCSGSAFGKGFGC